MIISNTKGMNLTLNDNCFFLGILIYCSKRQFDILDAGSWLRKIFLFLEENIKQ